MKIIAVTLAIICVSATAYTGYLWFKSDTIEFAFADVPKDIAVSALIAIWSGIFSAVFWHFSDN
ncbi:hypothetical protein [Ruegeria sp. ANG-R]|uniref:hypothetical protein n=1 Tax=Ruegeria sp. ANG-R TaxID=1577903 RepID=UPI001269B806|nr:hypothetical protein [Ruegeria sp. ANG-R]